MLARARCTNHDRQASGLCPGCSRPFCRECLTEHSGRLSCAACLRRATVAATRPKSSFKNRLALPAMALAALACSWFLFYSAGITLEIMTAPPAAAKPAP